MNDNEKQSEYKVLARKYRPQTFADLIGQETLVQTLTNAITTNRIAHAYLLTGVRGVGKTTTARLIAMSLNCESRDSDTFEPCSNCPSCHSIREDRNMDVIEMDAASKTGVDDIREIIDNVKYKPINCKYKIFIIDEVHMLSKSAFNALLKTLEEPPPHIKFIFATTEIKKIPITIISRCQRFDLHRVDSKILIDHLISISKKENIIISKDALAIIVRAADGSVRDGLSLLDQASANASKEISSETVINMLGLANREIIFELLENIFIGDANKSLEIYNSLYKSGADVVMIFDEMLKVVHFLTQIKIMKNIKDDINIPELERKKGLEIGEKISISTLGLIWQVLFKGFQELQTGFNVFQLGEMLIIRLIYLHRGPSPENLIDKIEKDFPKKDLNKEINTNLKSNDPTSFTVNKNENLTNSHKDENNTDLLQVISFRQLVDLFYQNKEAMLHTYLYNNVKLISFNEGEIVINDDSIQDPNFKRTVAKYISKWTGRIWKVISSNSNIGKTLYEEDLINQQKQIELMKDNEEIKLILNKFPDVEIHSITDISETTKEKTVDEKIKLEKEK